MGAHPLCSVRREQCDDVLQGGTESAAHRRLGPVFLWCDRGQMWIPREPNWTYVKHTLCPSNINIVRTAVILSSICWTGRLNMEMS
jgi:hypothetical protein